MTASVSLRQIALAVALLTVLGVAGPVPAARADSFEASGTFDVTYHHANIYAGINRFTSPGGSFTGFFEDKLTAGGSGKNARVVGSGVLDFGGGDTLTYDYDLRLDGTTGLLTGAWVVTGGTGVLAGASGGGIETATPDNTGIVTLSGTLDF